MIKPRIRGILESDADQLIALWRATWIATYGSSLGVKALTGMLGNLEQNGISGMLPGNDERGLCAVGSAGIMGSVIIAERNGKAYVWGPYIKPEHQRHGLGTKLLMAAASTLSPDISIEVRVLLTSEPAILFYRKHGLVEIATEQTKLSGDVTVATSVMAVCAQDIGRPRSARLISGCRQGEGRP